MDWSKGYGASYYITQVDPRTWADVQRIEVTGGNIKRELTGLRESADVSCAGYDIGIERWIRIYMDTRQNGEAGHEALFTGLATSPDDEINGMRVSNKLTCYSVLKPADDIYLQRGWYAPAGMNGGSIIKDLLAVTPAPVVVEENSPALSESVIAEDGETNLTMIDRILQAINWRIRIEGDGTINVEPKPTTAAATFDPLSNDLIEPQIKVSADWYSAPNVFMAIADDLTGVAMDDDEASPLSRQNRGREVWMQESGCDLADNESIGEYAMRRLKEEQQIKKTASYSRRYVPSVVPSDLIYLHYPKQGLDGTYMIKSQSVTLGYGARTSEEVSEV